MKIVDALTYLGESIYWRGEFRVEELIEEMDSSNVELAVVTPAPKPPFYREANVKVREAVTRYPDRLIGVYRVNPWFASSELEHAEKAVRDWGFKSILLDPQHESYSVESKILEPFMELACKLEIPVYIRSSNSQFNPPDAVLMVARKYPEVTVITEHSLTSVRMLLDEELAAHLKNVVLTTYPLRGGPRGVDRRLKLIAEKMRGRVVFASETPIGNLKLELKILELTNLDMGVKEEIVRTNIMRILNL